MLSRREWVLLPSQGLGSHPGLSRTEATQAQAKEGLLHTFPGTYFLSPFREANVAGALATASCLLLRSEATAAVSVAVLPD